MKRPILWFIMLLCVITNAYSEDYYRVTANRVNARLAPTTSAKSIGVYQKGDVIAISEYRTVENHKWGYVSYTRQPHWVATKYLYRLSETEVQQLMGSSSGTSSVNKRKENVGYSWTKFNPELAQHSYYRVMYWITVGVAIYALIFFIVLFGEAKRRGVLFAHIIHGVLSLGLWFWVFKFATWQWMLPGFIVGSFIYPFAFWGSTKRAEEGLPKIIRNLAGLALIVLTYFFMRDWTASVMHVGFFSWLLSFVLTIIDIPIATFIGYPTEVCPECGYYCEQRKVKSDFLGSTDSTDVTITTRDYFDHRNETSTTITDYYKRITTQKTDYYRVDHYNNTYRCSHCGEHYTVRSTIKNFLRSESHRI